MNIRELKIKTIDGYSIILSGFLYLGLAFLFLTQKGSLIFAVKSLLNLTTIAFIILALFQLIGFKPWGIKRLTSLSRLFGFLINIIMAGLIYFYPRLVVSILPILFGLYGLFSGIIRLLIYYQYKKNKVKKRAFLLLEASVLMFFGLIIIIHPLSSFYTISNVIGIFFVFYGISFIIDGLSEALARDTKNGLISPGAYFEFLNREFLRKNSFVISRTIYYKEKEVDLDSKIIEEVN